MKTDYVLTERQTQMRGVFLTFRKITSPKSWWDFLLFRKQKVEYVKTFYPISELGSHLTGEMSYFPSGEIVMSHEWIIFTNLMHMKEAETEKPAPVEKIYSREVFRPKKEGWVNPEKVEPTGE